MRGLRDEKAFEKRIERRRRRRDSVLALGRSQTMLSLGPLMDVVTIILVYFIFNFSVSPISVQDPAINLPESTSREQVKDAVVIVITGGEKRVAEGGEVKKIPNIPTILVNKTPLLTLDPEAYRIPGNLKNRGYVIAPLLEKLQAEKQKMLVTHKFSAGLEGAKRVAIVADKKTPYRVLTDVLVTCGEAGFNQFKFTIAKGNHS